MMKKIRLNSAGIDIGAKKLFVSIENQPVKSFETFTEDLEMLATYLISHGIKTVAMEATGVYWVILYDILMSHSIDVWLVDGRSTKQVPGRKTDVKDCQWIQQLHSYGLLNKCFIPDNLVQELRTYQRLREDHIRSSAMHIQHMQKALILMNIRLKEVISQIHGASGIRIIRAILSGERSAEKLASLCDSRILKTKKEWVMKSLKGHYNESCLFSLEQAVNCYDFYQQQITNCDIKLEQVLKKMHKDEFGQPKNNKARKPIRHHKPNIDNMGAHLMIIFKEIDATVLPGITDYNWMQLLAEIGADLKKWKSEKHFTSWLGLAPKQHNSGKRNRNYKSKGTPKAGLIFKQAAVGLLNSKHIALGAFGRKIRSKKGGLVAIKAVARKLAELYWKLFVKGLEYVENGIHKYQERMLLNKQRSVKRMARELGLEVI
ncbi:Transposase IS116/IS110/IS902 family protein [Lutibacter agarilyticus]|uniref:Transposase IS116/IS110/IS902 family protein n=2 Tax=Lutibacter agarilyticus TaxID=1109740 RepID=A0A238Y449_9FLAO|nr:Transposase IS116/IS110/IS902 family protein [Lutibacter agarilyticus]